MKDIKDICKEAYLSLSTVHGLLLCGTSKEEYLKRDGADLAQSIILGEMHEYLQEELTLQQKHWPRVSQPQREPRGHKHAGLSLHL